MRKIIILLVILVLGVAAMCFLYFSKLNKENDTKDLALLSATNNAAVLFSFQNDKSFYQIIEGQHLLQKVLGTEKRNLLIKLKESIIDDDAINDFIKNQPLYLSILPARDKTLNFLLTVQIQPNKTIDQFKKSLNTAHLKASSIGEFYEIRLNDGTAVFFGIQNQVITASTSIDLIKGAALRQKENPFTAYIKANLHSRKNVLANLYINFNQAPAFLQNILTSSLNGELSILNQQNSFASLNYNFSKERILFNGSTLIKTTSNYLKLFEDIPAQNISITNLLPENTANYCLYAIDSYKEWKKKLDTWFKEISHNTVDVQIKNIQNQFRVNLNTVFPVYTKNQFITFQLSTSEKLGAISLSNGEKVKQLLLDVSEDYTEDIKLFKAKDILYCYFGEPFKKFSQPYYTIIDNNLIISNHAGALQSFLKDYKNNHLLTSNLQYLEALNQVSNTENVAFYVNLKNITALAKGNLSTNYYKHLRADDGLKEFNTFYYQLIGDKDKFITNLLLNKYLRNQIPDTLISR